MNKKILSAALAVSIFAASGLYVPALAQTTTSEPSREQLEEQVKSLQLRLISLLQLRKAQLETELRLKLEAQVKILQWELIRLLENRLLALKMRLVGQ